MKPNFSENIKRLRKERSLTQEQLAEALGVTVGAVYKWENGRSVPELEMLMQLADLFQVSLDALVGFAARSGGADAFEARIHALQREKHYDEGVIEAEKALLRYPNDFRIVYRAGQLYAAAGIERSEEKFLYRCIALLERAVLLLSQNTAPEISEVSIQTQIAQCHIVLGKTKKGIDILKKYNVGGVHDALIAIAMTGNDITYTNTPGFELEDAVPYMVDALGALITNSLRTMMAYANYYYKSGDYASSREALLWLIDFLLSLKIDPNKTAFVDKVIAPSYSECANLSLLLGEREKAEPYLRCAYEVVRRYDAAPTCTPENIKFYIGDVSAATSYDDLGESAAAAVVKQITQDNRDSLLYELWQRISAEGDGRAV